MSGRVFVGVAMHHSLDVPTVVSVCESRSGAWSVRKTSLPALADGCEIGIERFNAMSIAVALTEQGHDVALVAAGLSTRRAVAATWRAALLTGDDGMSKAALDAVAYAADESKPFHSLSPSAAAIFYAMARASRSVKTDLQQRDASVESSDKRTRFFGIRLVAGGRITFVLGLRYKPRVNVGRKAVKSPREIAGQQQGGDFGRTKVGSEQVSEHEGVSEVAGCAAATGARVAGRSEQAAGGDRGQA